MARRAPAAAAPPAEDLASLAENVRSVIARMPGSVLNVAAAVDSVLADITFAAPLDVADMIAVRLAIRDRIPVGTSVEVFWTDGREVIVQVHGDDGRLAIRRAVPVVYPSSP